MIITGIGCITGLIYSILKESRLLNWIHIGLTSGVSIIYFGEGLINRFGLVLYLFSVLVLIVYSLRSQDYNRFTKNLILLSGALVIIPRIINIGETPVFLLGIIPFVGWLIWLFKGNLKTTSNLSPVIVCFITCFGNLWSIAKIWFV